MLLNKFWALFPAGFILFLFSCNSNPNSPTSEAHTLKISIRSIGTTNAAVNKKSAKSAANIAITSVRVVIDEVELESSEGDSLNYKLEQPFVEDLLAGAVVHEIETVQVAYGSYKDLEIEIDELNPVDGAVYTDNPELQNRSILIKGYLNGDQNQAFAFASDLEEEQEQEFTPPLILDENSPSTNVVLTMNMDLWFVGKNGNLIDPRLPQNQSAIEENIKNSIDVFEDKDGDGEKDDD